MQEKYWREKIAAHAAHLMCDAAVPGYEEARQEAIRILRCGPLATRHMPTKQEIRDKVKLLARDQQRDLRQRLLRELVAIMRPLQEFNPRIDATILEGLFRPDHQFQIEIDDAPRQAIIHRIRQVVSSSMREGLTEDPPGQQGSEDDWIHLAGEFLVNVRIVRNHAGSPCDSGKNQMDVSELEWELDGREGNQRQHEPAGVSAITDRFVHYASLLYPLESVNLSPERHPEKDALYHSLQVFQLAMDERPYDEEFLLAALLHDVGKAIDPQNHVDAGLEALADHITERTALLIQQHHLGHQYLDCTLGVRARRRLEADPNFEELLVLAECDKRGRQRGVAVPEIDQALQQIRDISEDFSGSI